MTLSAASIPPAPFGSSLVIVVSSVYPTIIDAVGDGMGLGHVPSLQALAPGFKATILEKVF